MSWFLLLTIAMGDSTVIMRVKGFSSEVDCLRAMAEVKIAPELAIKKAVCEKL